MLPLLAVSVCSAQPRGQLPSPAGFALVELFTSEGCSSCPPAEQLLGCLSSEWKNQPVYLLSYHVDYWNHLGWKDAYSDPAYTKRQRDYAASLHLSQIYTPQVVVNGTTDLVGSNEKDLRTALSHALNTPVSAELAMQGHLLDDQRVKLTYRAQVHQPAKLLVAFVQREAQTNVRKGENGGRRLFHWNVVRKLAVLPLTDSEAIVPLPMGFAAADWEIITFLQHPENGHILMGKRVSLLPTAGKIATSEQ